jgi:hypothetical protein
MSYLILHSDLIYFILFGNFLLDKQIQHSSMSFDDSLSPICSNRQRQKPESKFLVTKFELGWSFGKSLEGDCHELEDTPNLELLVTFGMSLEGVCHELCT